MTTRQQPSNATHWSTRTMAARSASAKPACGASGVPTGSNRIAWKPSRSATILVRRETGRHRRSAIHPPEHALVLCVDEKSRSKLWIDSAQPAAKARTRRHHDTRLQTQRHRHSVCRAERGQWRGHWPLPGAASASGVAPFLRLIDQTIPPDRQLHLICDNYANLIAPQSAALAEATPALSSALHTVPARPGSTWSNASFAT